jgi:hypothetical protein
MNSIELNERWVKALQLIGEHIKANNDLKKEIAELKEEIYFADAGFGGYEIGAIGFVAKVEVTVVDSAGAATNSVLGGDVSFESERAALCSEVLMPANLV